MLTFSEHLLVEGRDDALWRKYEVDFKIACNMATNTDLGHVSLWNDVKETDPTPNKIYWDWLIRQFIKNAKSDSGSFRQGRNRMIEDFMEITTDLAKHNRIKAQLPVAQRDINYFRTYYELRGVLSQYDDANTQSQRQIKRDEVEQIKKDLIVLHQSSAGAIYIPKTHEASKFLGRGTKWCTSMTTSRWFDSYSLQGPLFVLVYPDGRKFQIHVPPANSINYHDPSWELQVMDHNDMPYNILMLANTPLWQHLFDHSNIKFNINPQPLATWQLVIARHRYDVITARKVAQHLAPSAKIFLSNKITNFRKRSNNFEGEGWIAFLEEVLLKKVWVYDERVGNHYTDSLI